MALLQVLVLPSSPKEDTRREIPAVRLGETTGSQGERRGVKHSHHMVSLDVSPFILELYVSSQDE